MYIHYKLISGAGTNLKLKGGGHPSGAKVGRGAPVRLKAPESIFWSCPPLYGSTSTISRFGERFRDGQYSLGSFFFAVFLLTVPPCPVICKSGGHVPLVSYGISATETNCSHFPAERLYRNYCCQSRYNHNYDCFCSNTTENAR